MGANDTGKRVVEMDEDLLVFALENCETSLTQGLSFVQAVHDKDLIGVERSSVRKIVDAIEKFKRLRRALKEAR